MLIKVLCCLVLASTTYGMINVHPRLVGRVIHVESTRTRAEYVTVSGTHDGDTWRYYMILPSIAQNEISYREHSSFLVRTCATDYVCLESVKTEYRNRFWAAEYPSGEPRKTIVLAEENYPDGNTHIHFKIQCTDNGLTDCNILPRRFSDYYVAHLWQEGRHTPGRYYASLTNKDVPYRSWIIHAPNPTEQEEEFFRMDNQVVNATHQYEETVSVGISDTKTTTQSVSYSVSMEVESAFKKFSASAGSSISQSWQTEKSTTYSQTITKSILINIPSNTMVVAYQLVGKYNDQFSIGAQAYRITSVDKDGNKMEKFVQNVDEIDVGSLMQSGISNSSTGTPTKERKEKASEPKESSDQRIYHHHDHYHYGEKKEL
ncbi:uncharacterized protein LOC130636713 [Hydractinia symbiolongicarpus]|uniref:uncharacterized protein LOC130636713 n=1 Tax=Hydractinia symbiolongicarpus TaxID=13093 RepID=UPI00254AD756|nr:uncharacterized protein LOC130636713 [Hydractinia symbiolongicarpus]